MGGSLEMSDRHYRPWQLLADADRCIFGGAPSTLTRRVLLDQYAAYADAVTAGVDDGHAVLGTDDHGIRRRLRFRRPRNLVPRRVALELGDLRHQHSPLRLEVAHVACGPAAVDDEDVAVYVAALRRRQKQHGVGDLLHVAGAAQRDVSEQLLHRLAEHAVVT